MAHKVLEDGRVVVDWTTGDPEGDRIVLLSAYMDFMTEVIELTILEGSERAYGIDTLDEILKKWNLSIDNQVDEVPRIWIKRPE